MVVGHILILEHSKPDPHDKFAHAHTLMHTACMLRIMKSRLSPVKIWGDADEKRHTYAHSYALLDKHLIYIRYKLGYRASDDIRCSLHRPNIVASAISQFVAYICKTRDRYR